MSNEQARLRWESALMNNYGTPPVEVVRGDGTRVWDADGNTYLDLLAGIAVNALGHAHPAVVDAVSRQVATLGHTSNLVANPMALELSETLLEVAGLAGDGKVLLVNSGSEANEVALKISRLTGRGSVVACESGFHGRTMGALTLTGQPAKQEPFAPLVPGIHHVPFGDIDALRAAVDGDTAAVFVEPIQGEAGVIPAPDGYLRAAREITEQHGALLVLDEVQTGIGRTGSWFAFQQAGIVPDVVTLAKGLGGGLPLGAVIGVGGAADLLRPGQHGVTFGGNPVCCAAGLAVLRTIESESLAEHARTVGKDIAASVEALRHPSIAGVRGAGLLLGIALREQSSAAVAGAARRAGYLVNPVTPDTLRLAPPLVLAADDAHRFVSDLPQILDDAAKDV
ncbi:acetylornithine transaminase [Haloechinothrix sp. YIM 98757]|uniref:Acetylornithine aminotransferase n=1 Tax=Haloechinothrix aidingensis TaxID=2752311 RepID=A0A838AFL0_9PSEU|nr:acetylornithine transaminase [Haloechinothrix aidingensis]MBA0128154.1 acetylornithine transaminase [Haloechinothrix aidingensis]